MFFTKCILSPEDETDGVRVSIMSRHTHSDGKTPDLSILLQRIDKHNTSLAPPLKAVGNYYRSMQSGVSQDFAWQEFEEAYLNHLSTVEQEVILLGQRALYKNITAMCIEESPAYCHRRLLAEKISEFFPSLKVKID